MHALDSLKKEGVPVIAGTAVIAISHNNSTRAQLQTGGTILIFSIKGGRLK